MDRLPVSATTILLLDRCGRSVAAWAASRRALSSCWATVVVVPVPAGAARAGARLVGRAAVGHEDAFPLQGLRIEIVHVDREVFVFVVEEARFQLLFDLRGENLRTEGLQLDVAARQHEVREVEVEEKDQEAEEEDRPVDRPRGDPEGAHGDDLGVGREAANRDENSEQQRHRHRQHDDVRQREVKQARYGRPRERAFDDHSGEVEEVLHQDDEGVEGEAEGSRPEHLLEDVAREDLHRRRRL